MIFYPKNMTSKKKIKSLNDIIVSRAASNKDAIAYTFLLDGEQEEQNLSFAQIEHEAKIIGGYLQSFYVRNERALLFLPSGLEFIKAFYGCLFAGIIAVPTFPPKMNKSISRLKTIIKNSEASIILTTKKYSIQGKLKDILPTSCNIINIDEIAQDFHLQWSAPIVDEDTTAFLQYTSGSTGNPKGVLISHKNILHNQHLIKKAFRQDKDSIILGWLPFYHDMGLVGNIIHPMFLGARSILMSPIHFLLKPSRWLKAISKYKATTSGGPNFAYDLCVDKISDEEKEGLNLKEWNVAFCGAEPIRPETTRKFQESFANCEFNPNSFQPCYGMAESTLLISAGKNNGGMKTKMFSPETLIYSNLFDDNNKKVREVVCCGKPVGSTVKIVNQFGVEQPEGTLGEIWISGKSVAEGYWNNIEMTLDDFDNYLPCSKEPFFKTGDLGLLDSGELYICGRKKDLIIIRGKNFFPEDIEALIPTIHSIIIKGSCAAFSIDKEKEEKLILVCEIEAKIEIKEVDLFDKIKAAVFHEFEIETEDIVFIKKASLPKTTSGKIQRSLCRELYLSNQFEKVLQRRDGLTRREEEIENLSFEEKIIIEIIQKELGLKSIDPKENLFSLGLDSIKVTKILTKIEDVFFIDGNFIYECNNIKAIADRINKSKSSLLKRINPYEEKPPYKPTSLQIGIWFDQQLKFNSNSYNIPVVIPFGDGEFNEIIFNDVIIEIIEEVELLRAHFIVANETPLLDILPSLRLEAEIIDLNELKEDQQEIEFNKILAKEAGEPFILENSPIWRIKVFLKNGYNRIVLVFHHLIADGTSLQLLGKEIIKRYNSYASKSPCLDKGIKLQFKDFILFKEEQLKNGHLKLARLYWNNQLKGIEEFRLPYDYSYADTLNRKGNTIYKRIDSKLSLDIKELAQKMDCSLFMLLKACFTLLLSQYSKKEEIIIGVPVSGRNRKELQAMIGPLVNTLLFRYNLLPRESFSKFLNKVKEQVIQGLKFQDYPFEFIIEELGHSYNVGKFPITSVMFNGLFFLEEDNKISPMQIFPGGLGLDLNVDINCYIFQTEEGICLRCDYKEALFKKSTILLLINNFEAILKEVLLDSDIPIEFIYKRPFNKLSKEETKVLINLSNGSEASYPLNEDLVTLIEKQVEKNPENNCLVYQNEIISYKDLNGKANGLAKLLQSYQVNKGDYVALLMDKGAEIPISMFALMKLGAPFVPIDIEWPVQRIESVLHELEPKLIIFNDGGSKIKFNHSFLDITIDYRKLQSQNENIGVPISLDLPIYGMYTSGSTGLPKCAINSHRGILNRLLYMTKRYGCSEKDAILFISKYNYDATIWQIFWPMLNGGKIVIPPSEEDKDFHVWLDLIEKEKISFVDFVPSVFNVFVDYLESNKDAKIKASSLRQLLIGGEALNTKSIKRFRKILPNVGITNTYGATEASIGAIFYELEDVVTDNIPIGRPIDNVKVLILDEEMQLVPMGVQGDLYLGGDCVGIGYYKDEIKTNNAFLSNPISEVRTEKIYKTGDLAFYLPDGNIAYVGRKDMQVKVKGNRLELGEIEKLLIQHDFIKDATILPFKDEQGETYLVAYLIVDGKIDLFGIKEFLQRWLPAFMIPCSYVTLKQFPLNGVGKVDKKLLAQIPYEKLKKSVEYFAPRNEIENKLVEIWKGILNKEEIGISNNFFEEGGDSLKAMRLLTHVQKELGIKVSFKDVFLHPTIFMFSNLINKLGESIECEPKDEMEIKKVRREKYIKSPLDLS